MRRTISMARRAVAALALVAAAAACDDVDGVAGPGGGGDLAPRNFDARYAWVLHGWDPAGLEPVGHAGVELMWSLPPGWSGEVFRVYARRAGTGSYTLISTVTSCADGLCRYTDINVTPGQSYDFFVATADEVRGGESPTQALRVQVPAGSPPPAPGAPEIVALDGALFIRWPAVSGAERYRIFLERAGGAAEFVEIGETDSGGFLDERVDNGVEYGYRIAAIDAEGRFSARGAIGLGVPRPDYHSELVWEHSDDPAASGFRFRRTDVEDPILPGTDPAAQWRLEAIDGALHIRPLGSTRVTAGIFTTALACGPGSEPDCISVDSAPGAAAFRTEPVVVTAASTYVFRVTGNDGRTHYAKVRVQGDGVDGRGRRVIVGDWAYQLIADDPRLDLVP